MDAEAKDSRDVLALAIQWFGDEIVEGHEEEVGECRAEGGTVDGVESGGGRAGTVVERSGPVRRGMVNRLAAGTEYFDGIRAHLVAKTYW